MHLLAVALVLLHGIVLRGPTQPVCRTGVSCSEPAAHETLVLAGAGTLTRVRTDARGRYSVRLRTGVYTVRLPLPLRIGRGISPARFTLRATRRLDFHIDTGIR